MADSNRVQQILSNLLLNALKYSGKDSFIELLQSPLSLVSGSLVLGLYWPAATLTGVLCSLYTTAVRGAGNLERQLRLHSAPQPGCRNLRSRVRGISDGTAAATRQDRRRPCRA